MVVDDEPICGEEGCEICPTNADFDAWQMRKWREDRQTANELLGLPRDFGLEPIND